MKTSAERPKITKMTIKDDIDFLVKLRSNIDRYLFLGHAPSVGSPGHDPDVDKMREALKDTKFQKLRRYLNEAKPRAKEIIDRFSINAVYNQYPPPAIGGPIIRQHLLDVVTENITWHRFQKAVILDIIDQAIGALRLEKKAGKSLDDELDDKLPILRSRYLDDNLQSIIDDTTAADMPISFIMIDIDNFKSFNDKFGHLIGDDVLKAVSTLILKEVGNKGKVVRFGGEEISVILANYDIDEAKTLAERIRKCIESYNFNAGGKENLKITISAGVSASFDCLEYKKLMEEADKAMMISKVKGRNQVNIFDKKEGTLSNELVVIESIKDTKIKDYSKMALEALNAGVWKSLQHLLNLRLIKR